MADFSDQNNRVIADMQRKIEYLKSPDATTLMQSWTQIIFDDNRDKVLAGEDKDGKPMAPVTYRPFPTIINIRSKSASRLRHGQRWNRKKDLKFIGLGAQSPGPNNNLSASEYRHLDGPPLAPRYQFSRVISNLKTKYFPETYSPGVTLWEAIGYWDEVVARDGVTRFLKFHFDGEPLGRGGPSIVRDLRGVRPVGWEKLWASFEAWKLDMYYGLGIAS